MRPHEPPECTRTLQRDRLSREYISKYNACIELISCGLHLLLQHNEFLLAGGHGQEHLALVVHTEREGESR